MNMKRYAIGICALLGMGCVSADPVANATSIPPANMAENTVQTFSGMAPSNAPNPTEFAPPGMVNNPSAPPMAASPNIPTGMVPVSMPVSVQNAPTGMPNPNPVMMPPPTPQGIVSGAAFGNLPVQVRNPGQPQSGLVPSLTSGQGSPPVAMQVPLPGGGSQTIYVPAGAASALSNIMPVSQAAPGGAMPQPSMPGGVMPQSSLPGGVIPQTATPSGGVVTGNTRIIDNGGNLRVIVNPIPVQGDAQQPAIGEVIPTGMQGQQQGQGPAQNVIIIQPNAPQEKPAPKPPLIGPPPPRQTAPAAPGMNAS